MKHVVDKNRTKKSYKKVSQANGNVKHYIFPSIPRMQVECELF